jgi:Cu/Zn superoxide dismutase
MASGSAMSGGAMMGSSSKATVSLSAQNDSKETGTATLTETKKGLVVTVTTDTAPDSPQPDHIHKGTCAKLDPVPAYPLKPIEKSGDSKGMSTTTLTGVTLADLEKGEYAINVHKSADDLKDYVACGDIKAP